MNSKPNDRPTIAKRLNQYCLEECSFSTTEREQADFIKVLSERSLAQKANVKDTTVLGLTVLVTIVLTGILTWIKLAQIKKRVRNFSKSNSKNNHQVTCNSSTTIPCRECQFFHHNAYLKCAVNPSKVLQLEAIECKDYTPQTRKKRFNFRKTITNNNDTNS